MEFKDHYKILGVPRGASSREIKAAWRDLARKWHPDLHPGDPRAQERFAEINRAYEVLKDPEARRQYDLGGRRARPGPPPGGGGPVRVDLGDLFGGGGGGEALFESLFGGGRRGPSPGPRPGSDRELETEITLEEALKGTIRQVSVEEPRPCPACGGRGGRGGGACAACGGSGRVRQAGSIEVKVPAGVTEGSRVKVRGHGAPGAGGGPSGDLLLKIRIRSDGIHEVKGRDLHRELPVPLFDALLGGEVHFQGPRGGTLLLKVPPETANGKVFRLSGQGLPGPRGAHGDLFVRCAVVLPAGLDEEQRALLRRLAGREGR